MTLILLLSGSLYWISFKLSDYMTRVKTCKLSIAKLGLSWLWVQPFMSHLQPGYLIHWQSSLHQAHDNFLTMTVYINGCLQATSCVWTVDKAETWQCQNIPLRMLPRVMLLAKPSTSHRLFSTSHWLNLNLFKELLSKSNISCEKVSFN